MHHIHYLSVECFASFRLASASVAFVSSLYCHHRLWANQGRSPANKQINQLHGRTQYSVCAASAAPAASAASAASAALHRRPQEVRLLVLDEADKLLELGFLEQVDTLLAACSHAEVSRALFSATMLPAIESLADTVLRQPVRVVVGEKNAAAETVEQSLVFVGREDGKMLALRQMIRQGIQPPVLIFVQSKAR